MPSSRRRRRRRLRRAGRAFYVAAAVLVLCGVAVTARARSRSSGDGYTPPATSAVAAAARTTVSVPQTSTSESVPAIAVSEAQSNAAGNTAPVITGPHDITVRSFGSTPLPVFSVSDAEERAGDTFGLLLMSASGDVSLGTTEGLRLYYGASGHFVPVTGSISAIRNALSDLRYTPDPSGHNYALTVVVSDFGNGGRFPALAGQLISFIAFGNSPER